MFRIAIVEDDQNYREQIHGYVQQYCKEHELHYSLRLFETANALISVIESEQNEGGPTRFDIIFFDIDMPGLNGMEAARIVRAYDEEVVIVFITNLKHYAIQGYAVGALDYILKPVDYYSFSLRFARALDRVNKKEKTEILVASGDRLVCLQSDDIYYVESSNRLLHYHTAKGDISARGTLKRCEDSLAAYHFVKCNHWYLVNLKHVSAINQNRVTVAGTELEISRRNKTNFVKAVLDYIGGGI